MGISRRSLAVAGLAAAFALASPERPAAAQAAVPGQEVSRRLFDEGVELENAKSFAPALAKFREAEQIRATPALRYHKGFCLENLGKLAAALDEYEAAERTARDQNKQETLKSAQGRLVALRPRVPQLSVKVVSPPTTEVLLDGVALAAPLVATGTKFRVDPGEHQISARAPEHVTKTIKVSLQESAAQNVDVTLERLPAGGAPPVAATAPGPTSKPDEPPPPAAARADVEPPHAAEPRRSIALPLATTAGAVVLVAGGAVAFVLAGGAADDAKTDCPAKTSCDDERSKVRTLDALALGGFVAGAALGGLSTYLWLSRPSRAEAASRPRLRIGAQGIFLEGSL